MPQSQTTTEATEPIPAPKATKRSNSRTPKSVQEPQQVKDSNQPVHASALSADTPSEHLLALALPVFQRAHTRSGLSESSFVSLLVRIAMADLKHWQLCDLERLLVAAERYQLDPTAREIFLMQHPERLTPSLVVGVDGWCRLINSHPQFAGLEFAESSDLIEGVPSWIECTIHRWDRRVPVRVREYLQEVRTSSLAWLTHPRRMLRHKAMTQCARVALSLGELCDTEDFQAHSKALHPEPNRHDAASPDADHHAPWHADHLSKETRPLAPEPNQRPAWSTSRAQPSSVASLAQTLGHAL